VVQALL